MLARRSSLARLRKAITALGASVAIGMACGCSMAMSPLAMKATAFASAATLAIQDSEDAYTLVQNSYADVQASSLVVNYDKRGFHPDEIQPFLSDADLKARQNLLAGLKQYADTLAELSGSSPVTGVDTAAEGIGHSLQALAKNGVLPRAFQKTVGGQRDGVNLMQAGTTAVAAIGEFLVERKLEKDLPHVIETMQQPINNACALLEADIGSSTSTPGLRSQIAHDYSELLMNQDTYIRNTKFSSPSERRGEILKLPAIVREKAAADQTLIATRQVLQKFAAANDALASGVKTKESPEFRVQLGELIAEAEHLKNVYDQSTAKGSQ